MFASLIALAALSLPPAATTQDAAQGTPPKRIRNVQLLPNETCPKAGPDEIVVCDSIREQFRIPPNLREPANPAANQSWASRAEAAMDDNRKVLPGSCSTVGSNGATGCAQKAAEAWAAEKRAQGSGTVPQ